jgi:hypothetical protein
MQLPLNARAAAKDGPGRRLVFGNQNNNRREMKLSELIQHVGDEHVEVQTLEGSLVNVRACKSDGEITFATDRSRALQLAAGLDQAEWVGLVVWLPRERMPKAEAGAPGVDGCATKAPGVKNEMHAVFLEHAPRFVVKGHPQLHEPVKIWNYRSERLCNWNTLATDGRVLLMVHAWEAPGASELPSFSWPEVTWAWALSELCETPREQLPAAPVGDWRWVHPGSEPALRELPGLELVRVRSVMVNCSTNAGTTREKRAVAPGAAFFRWAGGVGLVIEERRKS